MCGQESGLGRGRARRDGERKGLDEDEEEREAQRDEDTLMTTMRNRVETSTQRLLDEVIDRPDGEVLRSFFDLDNPQPWEEALRRAREHAADIMAMGHTMLQRQVQMQA